jgi:chromosome segregation ATPase
LIQNSSQDLAELKERIKIIQNELEILKNESSEKDKTLQKFRTYFGEEVHKRDKGYGELNKLEVSRKQKKEVVDQQINEIEKLNMIIHSLEKEMLQLRHQYEVACENRNFIGIQLIDRNDELCILYEKANIQENILRNGERDIQGLEDDIRMIKIEISEIKRKIEVARKTVAVVPTLADDVIQLKNELQREKEKEKEIAEALENPENSKRYRDLGGDDPDQEALEAKIQVLEERLNNKKEALLEKELILDEITNLSEKLRGQALEGRQSSLELSEKVNEFQARLKDLTRKMMATISELSMFQATALKLQQEQESLEIVLDEARERVDNNLPPLPETESEYQRMVRDKMRYQQEKEMRVQQDMFEKSMPPFAIRTTAAPRVQQYIPVGEMGLPKPYGSNAPFLPSEQGVHLRHYKNPEIKDIEI